LVKNYKPKPAENPVTSENIQKNTQPEQPASPTQLKEQPTSTATKQSSSTDETANWKTYRNEKYGFEVKYPSEFKIVRDEEFIEGSVVNSIGLNNRLVFIRQSKSFPQFKLSVENVFAITLNNDNNPDKCFSAYEIPLTEKANINGTIFNRGSWDGVGAGTHIFSEIYRTIKNNKCVEVSLNFISSSDWNTEGALQIEEKERKSGLDILNKMLSTFKFIRTETLEEWKTYRNEKYGFEFRYPSDWIIRDNGSNGIILSPSISPTEKSYFEIGPDYTHDKGMGEGSDIESDDRITPYISQVPPGVEISHKESFNFTFAGVPAKKEIFQENYEYYISPTNNKPYSPPKITITIFFSKNIPDKTYMEDFRIQFSPPLDIFDQILSTFKFIK